MRIISFYAGDDELARIQAEQDRFAAMGFRISESAAIRSLILQTQKSADEKPPVTQTQVDDLEVNGYQIIDLKDG